MQGGKTRKVGNSESAAAKGMAVTSESVRRDKCVCSRWCGSYLHDLQLKLVKNLYVIKANSNTHDITCSQMQAPRFEEQVDVQVSMQVRLAHDTDSNQCKPFVYMTLPTFADRARSTSAGPVRQLKAHDRARYGCIAVKP